MKKKALWILILVLFGAALWLIRDNLKHLPGYSLENAQWSYDGKNLAYLIKLTAPATGNILRAELWLYQPEIDKKTRLKTFTSNELPLELHPFTGKENLIPVSFMQGKEIYLFSLTGELTKSFTAPEHFELFSAGEKEAFYPAPGKINAISSKGKYRTCFVFPEPFFKRMPDSAFLIPPGDEDEPRFLLSFFEKEGIKFLLVEGQDSKTLSLKYLPGEIFYSFSPGGEKLILLLWIKEEDRISPVIQQVFFSPLKLGEGYFLREGGPVTLDYDMWNNIYLFAGNQLFFFRPPETEMVADLTDTLKRRYLFCQINPRGNLALIFNPGGEAFLYEMSSQRLSRFFPDNLMLKILNSIKPKS